MRGQRLLELALGSGGTLDVDPGSATSVDLGLHVEGRDLVDRCGERIVLRGVNEMIVWSSRQDGNPELSEIAKTRANSVRIVDVRRDACGRHARGRAWRRGRAKTVELSG